LTRWGANGLRAARRPANEYLLTLSINTPRTPHTNPKLTKENVKEQQLLACLTLIFLATTDRRYTAAHYYWCASQQNVDEN